MLKWRVTSEYHAVSQCARYHVARARVMRDGRLIDWYDGWFGTTNLDANRFAQHVCGSVNKGSVLRQLNAHLRQLNADHEQEQQPPQHPAAA